MSLTVKPDRAPEIITFGCRLNAYESEVIRTLTAYGTHEDTVIINTCAVTNEAARQARQTIRRIARERPEAKIIVTGCAAQVEPERFAALPGVAHVIGNEEKLSAHSWLNLIDPNTERAAVNKVSSIEATAAHLVDGFVDHTRGFVQVQNGCDHRCTFCIIPYGRGPSRSVPAGEVIAQVRRLVEAGYAEIVLTGVDITSWGEDLPGAPKLGRLVTQILKAVPQLARLRLSSLDPVEIDEELMELIEGEARLMPHLHLSLQAGDDMILKRMKRRHLRDDAIRLTERVRARRPEIALGADLIAGFPTETEAMFENSLALIDDCHLVYCHIFPFSPKAGTPAARMPQVDRGVIKARAKALRDKAAKVLAAHLERQVGLEGDLLMEQSGFGRLPSFAPARLNGPAKRGSLVRARITAATGDHLIAQPVCGACQ